jgi:hypothetical protein
LRRRSHLIEDGTYSGEQGKERLAEIKSEIIATEIALSEARIEQLDVETAVTFATNFIGDLGRQWFDLPPDLRPRFQQLIFPEGVSYSRSKGFGTTKLGLIFELYRQTAGENPSLVDLMGVGWNQILAELREWQALRAVPTRISAA